MAASNTPLPDLIELNGIGSFATYTTAPGGGGDILGLVDGATYTDSDGSNTATTIAELNDGGTLTIGGVDYIVTLNVPDGGGNDFTVTYNNGASSIDLGGNGFSSEVVVIIATPSGGGSTRTFVAFDDSIGDLPDITAIQTRAIDFSPSGSDVLIDLEVDQNVAPVCLTHGTQIMTPHGPRLIENLAIGDLVQTLDHGPQPIRLILQRHIVFGLDNACHRPIAIQRAALGDGAPYRTLVVSPQHRVLCAGHAVADGFDLPAVFAPAKGLRHLSGVRIQSGRTAITYITLMLAQHEVIIANGAPVESFYPGPVALRLLRPAQRDDVLRNFPMLRAQPRTGYGPLARHSLTCREAANLTALVADKGMLC